MKKFIVNILVFFAIVTVVDVAMGKAFGYLRANRAGGRTGAEYYACRETTEDVIVMGSSRASHHYMPQIIADSLGVGCFNAGLDGNGIILQYGRWKMISERYTPKVVIYDVNPAFDLVENDNMTYVDRLKPFCGDKQVKSYVAGMFPMEAVKLFSQMYRYNYKWIEMVSDCRLAKQNGLQGYIPLKGVMRKEIADAEGLMDVRGIAIDDTKVIRLELLAKECQEKGTRLVFVVSPYFRGGGYDKNTFAPVMDIAKRYGAEFLYNNDYMYALRKEWYKDSQHLNEVGAKEFTEELVRQIKL